MALVTYILQAISDAELQVAAIKANIPKYYPELIEALSAKRLDSIDREMIQTVMMAEGFNCVRVDMFDRIMERTGIIPKDNCIPIA